MSKNTTLPLDPKALAATFRKTGRNLFAVKRADGYSYASDGIMLVRVPASQETAMLADTLKAFPELFRTDGVYRHGTYEDQAPDLAAVWRQHVPEDAATLPTLTDTRLTYEPYTEEPPVRVYHHPGGAYAYLRRQYTDTLTGLTTLHAAWSIDRNTAAIDRPVLAVDGANTIALVMPAVQVQPEFLDVARAETTETATGPAA